MTSISKHHKHRIIIIVYRLWPLHPHKQAWDVRHLPDKSGLTHAPFSPSFHFTRSKASLQRRPNFLNFHQSSQSSLTGLLPSTINNLWLFIQKRHGGSRIQLLLKRLPDSSVCSLILAGWCQEEHPVTKNLVSIFPGVDNCLKAKC